MQTLQEQYRSVQDPHERSRRGQFLSSLFSLSQAAEDNSAFVQSLVYDERIPQECLERGLLPIMRTDTPLLSRFHHPGSKSVIRVFPRAFAPKVHATLDEFRSTLFDHEGWHAREYFESPEEIVEYLHPEYIRHSVGLQSLALLSPSKQSAETAQMQSYCDVRAYEHQLLQIERGVREVSDKFTDAIERERSAFLNWLSCDQMKC